MIKEYAGQSVDSALDWLHLYIHARENRTMDSKKDNSAWTLPDDSELVFIPPSICIECIMDDHGNCSINKCKCREVDHTYYDRAR